MRARRRIDPRTIRAREEAEGVEVFEETPRIAILVQEREEAQGVESFVTPEATLSPEAVREGRPGEEILSGESAGLEAGNEHEYGNVQEPRYPDV